MVCDICEEDTYSVVLHLGLQSTFSIVCIKCNSAPSDVTTDDVGESVEDDE